MLNLIYSLLLYGSKNEFTKKPTGNSEEIIFE